MSQVPRRKAAREWVRGGGEAQGGGRGRSVTVFHAGRGRRTPKIGACARACMLVQDARRCSRYTPTSLCSPVTFAEAVSLLLPLFSLSLSLSLFHLLTPGTRASGVCSSLFPFHQTFASPLLTLFPTLPPYHPPSPLAMVHAFSSRRRFYTRSPVSRWHREGRFVLHGPILTWQPHSRALWSYLGDAMMMA